jgi:NADH-quinone oxidoreductase subunit J
MNISILMFTVWAVIIVVFSLLTVLTRRILRAATYLLFVLVATAGLYFMLSYEFLAGIQLALYAGGIVVLIIFSILLTSHISHKFDKPNLGTILMALLVAVSGLAITAYSILQFPFSKELVPNAETNMKVIGTQLVSTGKDGYALPFEVISLLLLAAMIGSILIARKDKPIEKI